MRQGEERTGDGVLAGEREEKVASVGVTRGRKTEILPSGHRPRNWNGCIVTSLRPLGLGKRGGKE